MAGSLSEPQQKGKRKELTQDAAFLKRLWSKVIERRSKYKNRSMLYGELGLAQRILRDFVGTELTKILIDSRQEFETSKSLPPNMSLS